MRADPGAEVAIVGSSPMRTGTGLASMGECSVANKQRICPDKENCITMANQNELEQAWQELQDVPSYVERFDPNAPVHMIIVQYCESCDCWHNADDGCPQVLAEV